MSSGHNIPYEYSDRAIFPTVKDWNNYIIDRIHNALGFDGLTNTTLKGNINASISSETVTAVGGINPSKMIHHIEGSGGPVEISASPQIAAGEDGQILILEGDSDTNTVTINNGNGVHLHSKAVMQNEDVLILYYSSSAGEWEEITRNFASKTVSFSFTYPSGTSGTFYTGGFYLFNSGNSTFVAPQMIGTVNSSHASHVFLVNGAQPASDSVIRFSGTSITDAGVRTPGDTEDVTFLSTDAANTYHETSKKWVGQVTITFISGDNTVNYNWGLAKYWDNNNNNFFVNGVEVTGRAGANDATPNFILRHHKATGWTYNAGAAPTPPTQLADMNTDHNTEIQLFNGENFAWKRDNINQAIAGGDGEGLIFEFLTSANKAVEQANLIYDIRPS